LLTGNKGQLESHFNYPYLPFSSIAVCRYNREEVVRSLGKEVNLNPPLTLGQLPDTPEELLKLDQVFIKSELKVGVIYVKEVRT
jgi:RAP1 GTPase activating protein 1